ncbi:MAG: RDD family protein [Halioglobus sp.]
MIGEKESKTADTRARSSLNKAAEVEIEEMEYAGFWVRVGASLIDTILLGIFSWPILTMVYGQSYWSDQSINKGVWDMILSYILPAVAIIVFWVYKSATPGKMALRMTILDADTGGKPSTGQMIGRYAAYYVSAIPFGLGFIWVGVDKRKQGWHDKLARTVVVRSLAKDKVSFNK